MSFPFRLLRFGLPARDYALTELHRAGVDPITMQARAGHADLRSTQTYITVDSDMDRAAAEKSAASLL